VVRQFAEVRVDADTGELRVTRLLGAFDVGRVINPRTARSQLVGGMTMALSAALFEDGVIDPRFGHVITQDLATYHVAAHADVLEVDAFWLGTPIRTSTGWAPRDWGRSGRPAWRGRSRTRRGTPPASGSARCR
jgi:CO/xanthine dehydrogenase Mo-binding subunit